MNYRSSTSQSLFAVVALLLATSSSSAQSILKTAGDYTVLGGQAVTVAGTGFTITDGNVGIFPAATSNITGFPPGTVSGTTLLGTGAAIINTGGATQQAQADLQVAAVGLAGLAANADYSNIDLANLGALPPGVYKWDAAATLTGALILDAQGRNNVSWVFQFGTGLTTSVNSTVTVINAGTNGGSDDGIFWNAETGAIVIGNNNTVLGNYIAHTSVSFTGSTLLLGNGGARFLAVTAAVTFAGPGTLNALGGPAGSDWTGGLVLNGSIVGLSPIAPGASRIINFSARGIAGAGVESLVLGFSVNGTNENLLVRGIGPTLGLFGIATPLADPTLTLDGASGQIATDTGWMTGGNGSLITAADTQVGAFALPAGSADSALLATVNEGSYTATISSSNASSGVALVEVYDTGTNQFPTASLTNVSARAYVSPGKGILIAGFVVSGTASKTVLIRGIGPTLGDFGITGALADPTITLMSGATVVASNSGWSTGTTSAVTISSTAAQVGAFPLALGSADSALLVTIAPGSYTILLKSVSNSSGIALVEIYDTQ